MSTVRFEISLSLDGYVTAPGVRPAEPMGDGEQVIHEWAFGDDERAAATYTPPARTPSAPAAFSCVVCSSCVSQAGYHALHEKPKGLLIERRALHQQEHLETDLDIRRQVGCDLLRCAGDRHLARPLQRQL